MFVTGSSSETSSTKLEGINPRLPSVSSPTNQPSSSMSPRPSSERRLQPGPLCEASDVEVLVWDANTWVAFSEASEQSSSLRRSWDCSAEACAVAGDVTWSSSEVLHIMLQLNFQLQQLAVSAARWTGLFLRCDLNTHICDRAPAALPISLEVSVFEAGGGCLLPSSTSSTRCTGALRNAGPGGSYAQEGLQAVPGLVPFVGSRRPALTLLQDVLQEESPLLLQFILEAQDLGGLLAICPPAKLPVDLLQLAADLVGSSPASPHQLLSQLPLQLPCLADGIVPLLLEQLVRLAPLGVLLAQQLTDLRCPLPLALLLEPLLLPHPLLLPFGAQLLSQELPLLLCPLLHLTGFISKAALQLLGLETLGLQLGPQFLQLLPVLLLLHKAAGASRWAPTR
eukprot:XP_027301325.1 uncharacterized protein LOC113839979 isoform X1 [Anas platyrhynchos]